MENCLTYLRLLEYRSVCLCNAVTEEGCEICFLTAINIYFSSTGMEMVSSTGRSLGKSSISLERRSQKKILMRCSGNQTQTKMERLILMVRFSYI